MVSENKNETARITIAIALVASFLTVILGIDKIIPDNASKFLLVIKVVLYVHFALVSFMFFLYLLFKARNLKYQREEHDVKASDWSVCLQFILLAIFKRKSLRHNRKFLRDKFNGAVKNNYKFYYDEGVRQSFLFPFLVCFYLLINYVPKLLGNFLILNQTYINLISLGVIIVGYVITGVVLNLLRFSITGEQ